MLPNHPNPNSHPLVSHLLHAHPDTIVAISNIQTGFLDFISESCFEVMGYTQDDLMKEGVEFWGRITHPEDVQANRQKYISFFSTGQQEGFNKRSLINHTMRFRIKHGQTGDWHLLESHNVILEFSPEGMPFRLLGIIRALQEQELPTPDQEKKKKGMLKVTLVGGDRVDISDREHEVLHLISKGNSDSEIAEQLVLSPHTIRTHRRNLMKKFGVSNTAS